MKFTINNENNEKSRNYTKIMNENLRKFAIIHENNENYEKLRKIMKFTKNNEKL